ncbi:MAG: RNA polymerase sigma-70 factor [Chitinophagaceae bacterium]|nr:RNA polymerase sigma-70 factor [Chitinophagaceae bacterium]
MNNYLNLQEYEKELLLQVREGDVKAFEYVYNIYSARLYGNIIKLVKSPGVAEELLQDIFQRVWEYRSNIDVSKSFKSYVFTIAKNLVCDYFNKESRQRLVQRYLQVKEEGSIAKFQHQLEEKESQQLLEKAVRQLPPQRQLVYTLCKIEGKSYEDVSKTLGISVSTISDHIVKATKSIKAYYLSKDMLYISLLFISQL